MKTFYYIKRNNVYRLLGILPSTLKFQTYNFTCNVFNRNKLKNGGGTLMKVRSGKEEGVTPSN